MDKEKESPTGHMKVLLLAGMACVVTVMFWLSADRASAYSLVISSLLIGMTVLLLSFSGWENPRSTSNLLVCVGLVALVQPLVASTASDDIEFVGLVLAMTSIIVMSICAAIIDLLVSIKPKQIYQCDGEDGCAILYGDLRMDTAAATHRIGLLSVLAIVLALGYTVFYPTELFIVGANIPIIGGAFAIRTMTKFAPRASSVWQAILGTVMLCWMIWAIFSPTTSITTMSFAVFVQVLMPPILFSGSIVAMRQAEVARKYVREI